ncbi:MAG: hypothetical protein HYR96_01270, partial [Deltaproteobacteria bacterium]|nr:hypothetical protein [Deltaproteobacteria bacterium]
MFLLIFFLWWGAVAEATDELPQITVKARREPVTAVPESSTTLEVEASAADVAQVAASIPTARTQRRGENDWELPTLRGELSGQNRWFLESIPLTSSAFGVSQAHLVPPEALAALQVFPGSIPASFAEDGLGGAFLMRFTWPEGRRVRAGVRLGSFGSRRMAVQGGIRNGAIDAIYHQGDDNFPYLDNNGTPFNINDDRWRMRENASFSRLTLLPRAQWHLLGEAGRSYVLISQGRSQIPGPVSAPDGGLLSDRYLLIANEWGGDRGRLAIFASFDGQDYAPGSGFGVVANGLKTDDRLLGVSYRSQLDAWRLGVQPQIEFIEMAGRGSSINESKWWLPLSVGWST